uniref:Uncharacterized protein n=1 Tax=Anguilla anguilla TaxID=7936 RepID=A0A0E9PZX7_ANGAN
MFPAAAFHTADIGLYRMQSEEDLSYADFNMQSTGFPIDQWGMLDSDKTWDS